MTIWNRCFACPIEFWHRSWSDFLPRQQKTHTNLFLYYIDWSIFVMLHSFNLERKVSSERIMWKFYTIFRICHIVFFLNWFDDLPYLYLNLSYPLQNYFLGHSYWSNFCHLVLKNLIKYMQCFKTSFEPCTVNDR